MADLSAWVFRTLLVAAITGGPVGLLAEEEPAPVDEVLEGFEDEDELPPKDEAAESVSPPAADERFWNLTGALGLSTSVNYLHHRSPAGTNYFGMQKLRTRLDLQLDLRLPGSWKGRVAGFGFCDFAYRSHGRGQYTHEVLDDYEYDGDLHEVYLQGSPVEAVDVKFGRQVVNWGRSDTLRVLDVLNPLDNREPGLVDLEDLRRPLSMVRVDYYVGAWSVTGLAIPEIRFDFNPPFGSDFNPFASRLEVPHEDVPGASIGSSEWAAAVNGVFHGWDVSFHAAYYWEDWPHLAPGHASVTNPLGMESRHGRQFLLGSGGNYTTGPWLLKAEAAYLYGVDHTVGSIVNVPGFGPAPVPEATVDRSRLDVMGGVEYYGLKDTSAALEVVERHVFGFDDRMRPFDVQRDAVELALRVNADFFNARLHTTALGVAYGEKAQDGGIVRLSAEYELRDALMVGGGILLYEDGAPFFMRRIGDNDRVFLEVKYSF